MSELGNDAYEVKMMKQLQPCDLNADGKVGEHEGSKDGESKLLKPRR